MFNVCWYKSVYTVNSINKQGRSLLGYSNTRVFIWQGTFLHDMAKYSQVNEPQRQKTYLRTCAPAKNTINQSDWNLSIASFWIMMLSFFMRSTKTQIRLRGCAGWFESSLDTHVRRYVFSLCGSIYCCYYWILYCWSLFTIALSSYFIF